VLDNRTDEELIDLCREGHSAAFEVLVRRYEKRLFNYIRRMVSSAADADDLFQDTFLRVYKNLHRFRAGSPFRPWVYRIATNICRDHLRRRGRRPAVSLDAPAGPDGPSMLDQMEAPVANPSEAAREAELRERLADAVDRLPVKHRAVFLMARYESLPYEEIARALRIPVGTVKSRMSKAVHLLLAELEEVAK
jgi:RNA polymerase sigma-70 factor (ECF subfamily)